MIQTTESACQFPSVCVHTLYSRMLVYMSICSRRSGIRGDNTGQFTCEFT